jgi:iron-sulfur cluster assembly accessory protein
MITITDVAVEKVKEILKAEGKEDWGLRIFLSGGGCCGPAYGMDLDEQAKDGDEVLEKDGLKVFADRETSDKLKGMQMDFHSDGENEGFVLKAPEGQAPSCGCSSGSCE